MSEETISRDTLTARQREWLGHLEAWREQGVTLRDYARSRDLSMSGLYSAKRLLTKLGLWERPGHRSRGRSGPKLVPVRLTSGATPMAAFRILLPNGIVVEVPQQADPVRVRALLTCVSGSLA